MYFHELPLIYYGTVLHTCWLELHGLSPELSLDSSILAENKVSRFCIAYTYGRMVAHLVTANQIRTYLVPSKKKEYVTIESDPELLLYSTPI